MIKTFILIIFISFYFSGSVYPANRTSNMEQEIKELIDQQNKSQLELSYITKETKKNSKELIINKAYLEEMKERINNFLTIIGFYSAGLLGVIGFFVSLSTILVIKQNSNIIKSVNSQLNQSANLLNDLAMMKQNYKTFYENIMIKLKDELQSTTKDKRRELNNYHYFFMLRRMIDEGEIETDKIYPLVTPLVEHPSKQYADVFNRLKEMDIEIQVKKKIEEGINKISSID